MSEFTLFGLRVVLEVASTRSFTTAAHSLGFSQPAISRQVAAMEAAAGASLFVREPRGVRPTPAGQLVADRARRLLAEADDLPAAVSALHDRLAGHIRVGAFPAATGALLPRTIAVLKAEHPGLSVRFDEASTPSLLRQLRARRIGVAVIGVGSGLPDYELHGLRPEIVFDGDLCVALPSGHTLARQSVIRVEDLTDQPWIVGEGPGTEPQFEAWPTLTDPMIACAARGWPARLGLVAAGLGVCLLPELAATTVPAGVTVARVRDRSWQGRTTVAVTRSPASTSARAVVATLRTVGDGLRLPDPS